MDSFFIIIAVVTEMIWFLSRRILICGLVSESYPYGTRARCEEVL